MQSRIYLLLFFLLSFTPLCGQSLVIEPFIGYATYSMSDLKTSLEAQLTASDIPLRITENFPNRPYIGFHFASATENLKIGIRYSHQSTGGRTHYRDYSGELGFDVVVSAHNFGLFAATNFLKKEKLMIEGSLGSSACYTYGNFKEYIKIGEESDLLSTDINSISLLIEPLVESKLNVLPFLGVGVRLGAALNVGGGLRLAENIDAKLVDDRGELIRADWSGFRSEITASFSLNKNF